MKLKLAAIFALIPCLALPAFALTPDPNVVQDYVRKLVNNGEIKGAWNDGELPKDPTGWGYIYYAEVDFPADGDRYAMIGCTTFSDPRGGYVQGHLYHFDGDAPPVEINTGQYLTGRHVFEFHYGAHYLDVESRTLAWKVTEQELQEHPDSSGHATVQLRRDGTLDYRDYMAKQLAADPATKARIDRIPYVKLESFMIPLSAFLRNPSLPWVPMANRKHPCGIGEEHHDPDQQALLAFGGKLTWDEARALANAWPAPKVGQRAQRAAGRDGLSGDSPARGSGSATSTDSPATASGPDSSLLANPWLWLALALGAACAWQGWRILRRP